MRSKLLIIGGCVLSAGCLFIIWYGLYFLMHEIGLV